MWQPSAIPGGSGCEMKHASSLIGVAFVTSMTQRLVSTCRKALALMIGKPGTKQLKDISPETPRATVNAGARGGRPRAPKGSFWTRRAPPMGRPFDAFARFSTKPVCKKSAKSSLSELRRGAMQFV